MGIVDAFSPEDRVQVRFSDFYNLIKESTRAEMMMNGIKTGVSHNAIHRVITGEPLYTESPDVISIIKEETK